MNDAWFKEKEITHVISACNDCPSYQSLKGHMQIAVRVFSFLDCFCAIHFFFFLLLVQVSDHSSVNISRYFSDAIQFIHKARMDKYVHDFFSYTLLFVSPRLTFRFHFRSLNRGVVYVHCAGSLVLNCSVRPLFIPVSLSLCFCLSRYFSVFFCGFIVLDDVDGHRV
jgi:hypothetical protein